MTFTDLNLDPRREGVVWGCMTGAERAAINRWAGAGGGIRCYFIRGGWVSVSGDSIRKDNAYWPDEANPPPTPSAPPKPEPEPQKPEPTPTRRAEVLGVVISPNGTCYVKDGDILIYAHVGYGHRGLTIVGFYATEEEAGKAAAYWRLGDWSEVNRNCNSLPVYPSGTYPWALLVDLSKEFPSA